MGVSITPIDDQATLTFVLHALQKAGYAPRSSSKAIHVAGAGVGLGDHSVDLTVDVVKIEDTKVVRLSSVLGVAAATFESASLAATRGNGACTVAKFDVVEITNLIAGNGFLVRASLILYADHLSEEEFTRMTWLYLKETDAIDNELVSMLESHALSQE